jgi:anthranilate phosphoribosyltransferase
MISSLHIKEAICSLVEGKDLAYDQAFLAMEEVMSGLATESQIGAFLTALRMKGETVGEISALAQKMREKATRINPRGNFSGKKRLTDTCGTGGANLKTFNVSTISALVVSGAGVPVAKHGNRSATSKCGSADLLERLGVNIVANASDVERSIENCGIGFIFAPTFHPAMKYVARSRKEIGIRSVFNILGPLTNPAPIEAQVVGVYEESLVRIVAEVLKKLGLKNVIVCHGLEGLDEISVIGKTHIAHLHEDGTITEGEISPATFGLKLWKYEDIASPYTSRGDRKEDECAGLALKILTSSDLKNNKKQSGHEQEEESAHLDMVLVNSSAALVVSGAADNFLEGIEIARNSINSGMAFEKLVSLIKYSNGSTETIESFLAHAT